MPFLRRKNPSQKRNPLFFNFLSKMRDKDGERIIRKKGRNIWNVPVIRIKMK